MNETTNNRDTLNYQLWEKYSSNTDITKYLRDVSISQKFYNGEQYATPNVRMIHVLLLIFVHLVRLLKQQKYVVHLITLSILAIMITFHA